MMRFKSAHANDFPSGIHRLSKHVSEDDKATGLVLGLTTQSFYSRLSSTFMVPREFTGTSNMFILPLL